MRYRQRFRCHHTQAPRLPTLPLVRRSEAGESLDFREQAQHSASTRSRLRNKDSSNRPAALSCSTDSTPAPISGWPLLFRPHLEVVEWRTSRAPKEGLPWHLREFPRGCAENSGDDSDDDKHAVLGLLSFASPQS